MARADREFAGSRSKPRPRTRTAPAAPDPPRQAGARRSLRRGSLGAEPVCLGQRGDHDLGGPEFSRGLSNGYQEYDLGWRLNFAQGGTNALELKFEGSRREQTGANDNAKPEHGIRFGITARGGRRRRRRGESPMGYPERTSFSPLVGDRQRWLLVYSRDSCQGCTRKQVVDRQARPPRNIRRIEESRPPHGIRSFGPAPCQRPLTTQSSPGAHRGRDAGCQAPPGSCGRNAHCCAPRPRANPDFDCQPSGTYLGWMVINGRPLVRPWVTNGGARPQDFGHALQSLPVEAGSQGPPAQCAYPQALQPAAKRTDEPARPWDGEVVEPAWVDPPKPRTDFPDVVVPAFAEYLIVLLTRFATGLRPSRKRPVGSSCNGA